MALQCGIIGLTNVGKTTLFNCVSSTKAQVTNFIYSSAKSNIGVVNVPDQRLKVLEMYQPTDRTVYTTVEIVDIPGLAKGASEGEGVGNKFLADLRNTDAIIHVLRCFDDPNLPHIEGSVDPVRDIELIDFELQVKDLEAIDKRIQKIEKQARVGGDKDAKRTYDVLKIMKEHLESLQNARTAPLSPEDKKLLFDLFLLSEKPILYVCNVDDASAVIGNKYVQKVQEALKGFDAEILVIAGKLESEISELETEEERIEFLKDAGLSEPGVNKLIRSAYHLLNLRTFFTIGKTENRAWTIHAGMTAPEAAGVIHSDLERGFIRAEVIKYNDFITLKSEKACKDAGKFYVEGKNYVVCDGDILHIRFNV